LITVFGWRDTFVVEGLVISGVMVPIIILVIRYHPKDKGLLRDGLKEGEVSSPATTGEEMHIVDPAWAAVDWTLKKAVRTKRFWFLALAVFSMWGVMEHILVTHHVAYAIDMGYSRIYASSVLSLFGVMRVFASLASMVSDRIGREVTITIGALVGISGILVLMLIRDPSHPWMLYFYALSYGFGIGICTPTIAAIITDIFQGPRVGFVIGAIWFFSSLGGAIGPWLGGWLFEIRGNYSVAFTLCAALFVLACAAFWLAAPRKVRRVRGKESFPAPKSSAQS